MITLGSFTQKSILEINVYYTYLLIIGHMRQSIKVIDNNNFNKRIQIGTDRLLA